MASYGNSYAKPNCGRGSGPGDVNLSTAKSVAEKAKKGGVNKSYKAGNSGSKNSDY